MVGCRCCCEGPRIPAPAASLPLLQDRATGPGAAPYHYRRLVNSWHIILVIHKGKRGWQMPPALYPGGLEGEGHGLDFGPPPGEDA